jgi:serine protease SohB
MLAFLRDYGLFLLELATFAGLVAGIAWLVASRVARQGSSGAERLQLRRLDDRYRGLARAVQAEVLPPKLRKAQRKANEAEDAARDETDRRRVYVLEFHGDIRASQVASLRDEVSAILAVVRPQDEVLLRLESPGGLVHGYGLAAAQLVRLRERGVKLTAVVDKVAASGGYLMAVVADRIVAAPFAVVGSIGVVAQLPNLHRWLQRREIDIELHTAGAWKRTLTVLGENTDEARQKFRDELADTHALFQQFVATYRPQLDLAQVATGEHWYGSRALELGLVDALGTSDDWLMTAAIDATVLELKVRSPRSLGERLGVAAAEASERVLERLARKPLP